MSDVSAYDVFNVKAAFIGILTMLLCLSIQASMVHLSTRAIRARVNYFMKLNYHLRAQLVFFLGALILLLTHIVQIYVWGYSLYLTGFINEPNTAIIFSGSTYTTVGFVNDPLPQQWQLITVIMATSGLFSFGWSTSVMFTLAQKLYPNDD
jgi:hypothetical protein